MPEYSCPRCGRALKELQLPSFCEGCGQHLVPQSLSTTPSRFWLAFLTISEFLALGLAVLARSNGAPFLGALLIIVLVNLAAAAVYAVWHRAFVPAAKEVKERGLVGISKSFYRRVLAPLLYGRSGAGKQ
jgi:hypothetical protein